MFAPRTGKNDAIILSFRIYQIVAPTADYSRFSVNLFSVIWRQIDRSGEIVVFERGRHSHDGDVVIVRGLVELLVHDRLRHVVNDAVVKQGGPAA